MSIKKKKRSFKQYTLTSLYIVLFDLFVENVYVAYNRVIILYNTLY